MLEPFLDLLLRQPCRLMATPQILNPNEPIGPLVKTPIPGPESQRLMKELSDIQVFLCLPTMYPLAEMRYDWCIIHA